MHPFESHGTYLRDYSQHGLTRLAEINERDALRLLAASPWVKANAKVTQGGLLLNKGFCVVRQDGDRAVIVNNHDGDLQLWLGPADFFKSKFNLAEAG